MTEMSPNEGDIRRSIHVVGEVKPASLARKKINIARKMLIRMPTITGIRE
jgi:hypothetical protein